MKRRLFTLVGLCLIGFAHAQTGLMGTKVSSPIQVPATSGGTGVGIGSLIQMLVALGVVAFILKAVLPRLAGKLNAKFQSKSAGGIKLEETVQIPGGAFHIVTVRGRTFLVGSTPQAIQHIAELTVAEPEIEPFEAALEEATPFEIEPVATINLEAAAQLDRLTQLTGGHGLR